MTTVADGIGWRQCRWSTPVVAVRQESAPELPMSIGAVVIARGMRSIRASVAELGLLTSTGAGIMRTSYRAQSVLESSMTSSGNV